jgi:hypothetical protein
MFGILWPLIKQKFIKYSHKSLIKMTKRTCCISQLLYTPHPKNAVHHCTMFSITISPIAKLLKLNKMMVRYNAERFQETTCCHKFSNQATVTHHDYINKILSTEPMSRFTEMCLRHASKYFLHSTLACNSTIQQCICSVPQEELDFSILVTAFLYTDTSRMKTLLSAIAC